MTPDRAAQPSDRWKQVGLMGLYLWIGGTAVFFFLRFSLVFAHANAAAIRRLFDG